MKLLVVILTVFVGSCYAMPGEDPCTWGPAYWCKDGASAKECSAIEYCQLNVWKDKDAVSFTDLRPASNKSPQSGLCEMCQMVVKYLKPIVDNNATEPKAQADLEEVCKLMGTYSKECTQYVREYFPMMFALLKQEVDTGELCQMLKFCNSTTAAVSQPKESPGVDLCSICKLVSDFLKGFVDANSSEEEAEKALEQLCSLLPGNYSSECKSLVDDYFPAIWQLLKAELDSGQICVILRFCNSTSGPLPVHSPKAPQADNCQLCKMVVNFIKPFVDSNTTEEEAQAGLDKLCALLPTIGAECKTFVNDYFPVIWKLLQNEVDSGQICIQIGLCPKPMARAATSESKQASGDIPCELCEMISSFLKPFLNENKTVEEILAALDKVCRLLPSTYSKDCDLFVEGYLRIMWKLLQEDIDSGDLCTLHGPCPSSATEPKDESPESLCDDCKRVVDFLRPFVDSNATEEEAKAAVEQFCKLIPSVGSTLCELIVDRYFDDIWKLLQNEVDTDKICQQIHLCPGTMAVTVTMEPASKAEPKPDDMARAATSKSKQASGESLCQMCELVTKFLKPFLDNNATEEEALAALEKFCSLLPSTYSKECDEVVKQYFPLIWGFLEQEIDSDQLCKLIGLCPSSATEPKDESPESLCDDCKRVVSYLRPFVDSNATEEEAKAAVEQFCKLIPSVGSTLCELIVDRYFDDIWKLLQNEVDTDKICQQIHLCPSTLTATVTVEPASKAEPKPDDIECDICGSILDYVYGVLKDNATKGDIEAILNKVCGHVPVSLAPLCKELVDKFTDELIQFIEADLPPNEICKKLAFCGAASRAVKPRGDIECNICELILKYAEALLAKNATEAEIEKFLDKVCDFFPVGRSECEALVKQYLPALINFIENEESPEKACQEIHVCSGMMAAAKKPKGEVECDLCTMVLKYVDAILTKNASEAEVVALLDKVCHYFPDAIQKECVAFVDAYAKDIIPLIVQELDPEKICTMIGVCPKGWTLLRVATRRV